MLRGLGNLMEVSQIIDLKYKISLNLEVGFKPSPYKFQELVVIGFLTLNLRKEKVLIHQRRSELA